MDISTMFPGVLSYEIQNRPSTNMGRIVFPFTISKKEYKKQEFNQSMTEDKLTEEDVDRVLKSLKKSKDYMPDIPILVKVIIVILLIVFMIIAVTIAIKFDKWLFDQRNKNANNDQNTAENTDEDQGRGSTGFFFLGFLLLTVDLCIICMLLLANFLYKKSLARREKDIKKYLSDFNANEFSAKGIEWRSGSYGAWVSVELNYVWRHRNKMLRDRETSPVANNQQDGQSGALELSFDESKEDRDDDFGKL